MNLKLHFMTGVAFVFLAIALLGRFVEPIDANELSARSAAASANSAARQLKSVMIEGIPHVRQKPDFCGEACAEMFLRKLGRPELDQDAVFDVSGLDPLKGRGCYTRELAAALRKIGFEIGRTWFEIDARQAIEGPHEQFIALHKDLLAGNASIICMHYDDSPQTTEHIRLIIGYDAGTDEVIYHEPAVKAGANRRMKRDQLLRLWPLKYQRDRWTLIRMPLKPRASLIRFRPSNTFTSADYVQHVRELRKRIPDGFHIVLQPPFVVVGDESPDVVQKRSVNTVKWAVDRLKKDYFAKDPEHIIDVWLFKDKASYRKHTREVFNDRPTTPFGYYSRTHRALIMNISTGGGTLVHEIVHPFMATNFEACPSWFDEGLASLYEQSADRGGHIEGLTNWRLAGLQKAIVAKTVPSFKTLCSTTTTEFYNEDPGTNYSQARYLCYYLQEHKLLRKYYQEFSRTALDDPTGYDALDRVLGERDMELFRKKWEAYVLTLRF